MSQLLTVIDNAGTAALQNTTIFNSTEEATTFNLFVSLVSKQMSAGEQPYNSILSNLRFESKVTTAVDDDAAVYTLAPPKTTLETSAGVASNNITFNLGNCCTIIANTNSSTITYIHTNINRFDTNLQWYQHRRRSIYSTIIIIIIYY